jgi:hypothetical protein
MRSASVGKSGGGCGEGGGGSSGSSSSSSGGGGGGNGSACRSVQVAAVEADEVAGLVAVLGRTPRSVVVTVVALLGTEQRHRRAQRSGMSQSHVTLAARCLSRAWEWRRDRCEASVCVVFKVCAASRSRGGDGSGPARDELPVTHSRRHPLLRCMGHHLPSFTQSSLVCFLHLLHLLHLHLLHYLSPLLSSSLDLG